MSPENCPDEPTIARFAHGLLAEDEAESVVSHIETCAACGVTVEVHARNGDDLIKQLRHASHHDLPPDPDCDRTLGRLREVDVANVLSHKGEDEATAPERIRDYQIVEKLGEGGMGVVFKALHTRMDRTVAIKILSQRHLSRPDRVKRFEREVKAIARLEHPNIVRATDAGEEDGLPFLVMEFVDGADLSSIVRQDGPLPVAEACEVIRQAAVGLQFAHDRGLIHRDVKPSNLILSPTSPEHAGGSSGAGGAAVVKILDLGLARLRSDAATGKETQATEAGDTAEYSAKLTRDGLIVGTIDYMAPEQARDGGIADERSDIYSLGCTFYFLLTGQAPFRDDQKGAMTRTLARHQHEAPRPLSDFRCDVPPVVDAVVARMMDKQPVDRYGAMAEVAASLADTADTADLMRLQNPQKSNAAPRPASRRNSQPATHQGSTGKGRHSGWRRFGLIVMLALFGGAAWLGVTTRKVDVGYGTMEVQFDDNAFEGTVVGETLTLKSLQTGKQQTLKLTAQKTSAPLAPGKYEISVATDSGLEIFGGPQLTIKTGESHQVVVRYLPTPKPPDAHRRAANRILELTGSTVTVRVAEQEPKLIARPEDLPVEDFELWGLYAMRTEFTNEDAKLLNGLTSLRSLVFYHTAINDDALRAFTQFHRCNYMALAECPVTSAGVIPLVRALRGITHLNVDTTGVGADLVPEVAKCESLQWLGLPSTISVTELQPLSKLKNPIHLRYYAPLKDGDLSLLTRLPLDFVALNALNLTGEGFTHLKSSPTLTSLGLKDGAGVTATSLRDLKSWPALRRLEFSNCDLTGEKLAALSEVRQLQTLQINADSLSSEDLANLKDLPELTTLYLFNAGLSNPDITALKKLLKGCQVITK